MENYCILSLEKIKTLGSLQFRHEHNFRVLPLSHVDISASDRNEELVDDTGMNYKELWYKRMKEVELETGHPVTVRTGAVLALEVVTTFSRGADVDIEAWKKANVEWMKENFGAENILSMQYHEDETTPHIHTIIIPIDDRGHLCAKSFTGGRKAMFQMQDSYAKAMAPLGLKRGEMYSRARKNDLNRYYALLNKAANAKAPEMMAGESVDNYVSRVNAYIQDIKIETFRKENEYRRALDVQKTKTTQLYAKYGEAIRLQQDIEKNVGGDYELTRERLLTYRKIEHGVPRKVLHSLMNNLMKKFPVSENVLFFREKKKKKNREANVNLME
jgi:hypothetical protein